MNENILTVVLPEPQVNVADGEYRLTGKAVEVSGKGNVLKHLRESGVYDSNADVANSSISYTNEFSIKDVSEEVDEILDLIDGKKLEKDLNKKGYAFLRTKEQTPEKFRDHKDKKFITEIDRVTQDLVYQQLPTRFPKAFEDEATARHFKTQEAGELMYSDREFKILGDAYWLHNLEIIQTLAPKPVSRYELANGVLGTVTVASDVLTPTGVSCIGTTYDSRLDRPHAFSTSPLVGGNFLVAALKRIPASTTD